MSTELLPFPPCSMHMLHPRLAAQVFPLKVLSVRQSISLAFENLSAFSAASPGLSRSPLHSVVLLCLSVCVMSLRHAGLPERAFTNWLRVRRQLDSYYILRSESMLDYKHNVSHCLSTTPCVLLRLSLCVFGESDAKWFAETCFYKLVVYPTAQQLLRDKFMDACDYKTERK